MLSKRLSTSEVLYKMISETYDNCNVSKANETSITASYKILEPDLGRNVFHGHISIGRESDIS